MTRPTKAELNKLAKAYALKIYSADEAPFHVQQRLHDAFMKLYTRLSTAYPQFDWTSDPGFWQPLRGAADKYRKSKLFWGSGRTW